jgi:hypothetical protein
MRYNPATDRAISIDEIAEQCRRAIMKAHTPVEAAIAAQPIYDEVLTFSRWEDDMLVAA